MILTLAVLSQYTRVTDDDREADRRHLRTIAVPLKMNLKVKYKAISRNSPRAGDISFCMKMT